MPAITDSVQFVKGIGPKKVKLFEKLHISTLQDALETYPRDYEDRTQITRIADIADEDRYAVRAILGTEPKVSRIRKGMTLVKCTIFDESGSLGVTWFNQPYITAQLRVGQEYLFYGRVQGFGRARQMISSAGGKSRGKRPESRPYRAGLSADRRSDAARHGARDRSCARRSAGGLAPTRCPRSCASNTAFRTPSTRSPPSIARKTGKM